MVYRTPKKTYDFRVPCYTFPNISNSKKQFFEVEVEFGGYVCRVEDFDAQEFKV